VLRAAMLRRCDKLLELAKHGPLYGGIVGVGASLTEGLDQAREERLALLAVEPWGTQRIASGTHTGSDSETVVDARLHRVLPRRKTCESKGLGIGSTGAQPQSD
jgi:hypothetical protein